MLDFLFRKNSSDAPVKVSPEISSVPPARTSTLHSSRSVKFAVIDTETTGVYVHRDRIVEIAIIQFDEHGKVIDEYCTLVNPQRDLGPSNIHGISAADACVAPVFSEIAGDILSRLKDSLIVGHNVTFDWQLLTSEFERIGVSLPSQSLICTMRMASQFGLGAKKLVDCCVSVGINPGHSHCALDDARSSLALFNRLRELKTCHETVANVISREANQQCVWPTMTCSGKQFQRRQPGERQPHYLKDLVSRLPKFGSSDTGVYSLALERALEDRLVTESESNKLAEIAENCHLSEEATIEVHVNYLRGLIRSAMADGKVTSAERDDLEVVASLVGLEATTVDDLLQTPEPPSSESSRADQSEFVGKHVCFTGVLLSTINGIPISREKAVQLASENGLIAVDSVTKKTDILILADSSSMSGKALKARQYGIRLMADRVFWNSIGVNVD